MAALSAKATVLARPATVTAVKMNLRMFRVLTGSDDGATLR
jgi:hypothetical protein